MTSTVRLGTLVSPATFRHPSELAKVVVTADQVSGGRVEWRGHGGGAEAFLRDLPDSWLAGTLDELTARLGDLAGAGVERMMLQHLLHRDLDAVEQIGRRVAPAVRGGAAA